MTISGSEQIQRLQKALDDVTRMNGSPDLIYALQKAIQKVRDNMFEDYS